MRPTSIKPRPAIYFPGNLDFTTSAWALVRIDGHARVVEHKEVDSLPGTNPRARIVATSNCLASLTQWGLKHSPIPLSSPTPCDPHPHRKADRPPHRFTDSSQSTTHFGALLKEALK